MVKAFHASVAGATHNLLGGLDLARLPPVGQGLLARCVSLHSTDERGDDDRCGHSRSRGMRSTWIHSVVEKGTLSRRLLEPPQGGAWQALQRRWISLPFNRQP